jgi:hypothetical protein
MKTLMERLKAEQIRHRTGSGNGLLPLPSNRRSVVASGVNGTLTHISVGDVAFMMQDGSCQFKIGVSDCAVRIFVGDQLGGQIRGHREPPQARAGPSMSQIEGDTAKACTTGVGGADQSGNLLCQFEKAGGTFKDVVPKPTKVVESVMDALVKAQSPFLGIGESKLEVAKKATGAGQSNRHRAKLAQKTMPTADRESALLLGNAVK